MDREWAAILVGCLVTFLMLMGQALVLGGVAVLIAWMVKTWVLG